MSSMLGGCAAWEWVRPGCSDPADAKSSIARFVYKTCVAAARAQACLKLDGLAHVGPGAQVGAGRRMLGADFHRRTREA